MAYIVYLFFGLAPSIIWLLFYLRRDAHPEPKRMVLQIFFYGMLIALAAAVLEIGIEIIFNIINKSRFLSFSLPSFLYYFIGVAFVEEFLKYFIVKKKILNNSEFDEPTDTMIYMIITALGFAALENILVLLTNQGGFNFLETTVISSLRFIGATFLHALCSGTIGFFLALSILKIKERFQLVLLGLSIATILHGFYNFSIMNLNKNIYFIYLPIIILASLAFFVSFGFKKLRKTASVCETGENKK